MKILFCSPCGRKGRLIYGGIGIWSMNILTYAKSVSSNIELVPVSFSRKTFISNQSGILKRLYYGLIEVGSSLKEAIQKLNNEHFDIVHISSSASLSLVKDFLLIKAAHRKHVKTVVHFHFGRIPDLSKKRNWEWKFLMQVIKTTDMAITMDMNSYHTLKNCGFKNVEYCPNPLSLDTQNKIAVIKNNIIRKPRKILFVGYVVPTKGIFELVEACKQLDNIELHIIGKAEETIVNEIKTVASEKENGNWIVFHGNLPHDGVIEEMLSAGVFVLPTYTEGFPNVILEAMACQCPIVTTPVGAIPEILDFASDNPCGVVVPPKNVSALYSAILSVLSDNDKANILALRAKTKIEQNYLIDIVWKRLIRIWQIVDNSL